MMKLSIVPADPIRLMILWRTIVWRDGSRVIVVILEPVAIMIFTYMRRSY